MYAQHQCDKAVRAALFFGFMTGRQPVSQLLGSWSSAIPTFLLTESLEESSLTQPQGTAPWSNGLLQRWHPLCGPPFPNTRAQNTLPVAREILDSMGTHLCVYFTERVSHPQIYTGPTNKNICNVCTVELLNSSCVFDTVLWLCLFLSLLFFPSKVESVNILLENKITWLIDWLCNTTLLSKQIY